jgi:hypothetical protein
MSIFQIVTVTGMRIPFGRHWHRWEYDIKMDLREMRLEGVDWNQLAEDRDQWHAVLNTVTNICIQFKAENFLRS